MNERQKILIFPLRDWIPAWGKNYPFNVQNIYLKNSIGATKINYRAPTLR